MPLLGGWLLLGWQDGTALRPKHSWASGWCWSGICHYHESLWGKTKSDRGIRPDIGKAWHHLAGRPQQMTEFGSWTWLEFGGLTRHQETGRRLDLNQEIRNSVLEPEEPTEFITQTFIECLLHVIHSPRVCWLISGWGPCTSLRRSLHDSHVVNILLFKSYPFLDIF